MSAPNALPNIETGSCVAFGGSNARTGLVLSGDVTNFRVQQTPQSSEEFFAWTARSVLDAADSGAEWTVAGFPGPVADGGTMIGPMVNVGGLRNQRYDLRASLVQADPAVGRLLEDGFELVAVNDGELAAQAAAGRLGQGARKVAALILGTGQGTGVVKYDPSQAGVYRPDDGLFETGHLIRDLQNINDTPENTISGPAIQRYTGVRPEKLGRNHHYWAVVGYEMGRLATDLGMISGVDLVVPTGGVGAGASRKYGPHMQEFLDTVRERGNAMQRAGVPQVRFVAEADRDVFEMFGAEGVMRDMQSRPIL